MYTHPFLDFSHTDHYSILRRVPCAMGLPGWCSGNEPICQCRRCKRQVFNRWVRKIPWNKKWLPTPVFLPGKFHGQRNLVGYSPWSSKESDTTECVRAHTHTHPILRYTVSSYQLSVLHRVVCTWQSQSPNLSPPMEAIIFVTLFL